MELSNLNIKNGLCLSLGANIDSKFGSPINSLIESKFKIEKIINNLIHLNHSDTLEKDILKYQIKVNIQKLIIKLLKEICLSSKNYLKQ